MYAMESSSENLKNQITSDFEIYVELLLINLLIV